MRNSPRLLLNDGHTIPQLGTGVWQIPDSETAAVVRSAIATGYRLLDGAFIYGNERGLGEGVRTSGLPREELFVTTKVWNADQGREQARTSVARSLEAMQLDYFDLVLIHWPCPRKELYFETWQSLIDMRSEGLMRSIGVSNFNADHLDRIIDETGVVPSVNQIEVNPRMQNGALRAENARRGIVSQHWTPLGEGKSFPAPIVQQAAVRTGRSPAQVILRWHVQLGSSVIPRATDPSQQRQNLELFDFELTDDEMAGLAMLDWGSRCGPDPLFYEEE